MFTLKTENVQEVSRKQWPGRNGETSRRMLAAPVLGLGLSLFVAAPAAAQPFTWFVAPAPAGTGEPGGDCNNPGFNSIAAVVGTFPGVDGPAGAGDTVIVCPGTYIEPVIDTRAGKPGLRITSTEISQITRGGDPGVTQSRGELVQNARTCSENLHDYQTIVQSMSGSFVFSVRSSGVEIAGFEITGATETGHAGVLIAAPEATIHRNLIHANRHGIRETDGASSTIHRNVICDNLRLGILLAGANGSVHRNSVENNLLPGILISKATGYNVHLNFTAGNLMNNGIRSRAMSSGNMIQRNILDDGCTMLGTNVWQQNEPPECND